MKEKDFRSEFVWEIWFSKHHCLVCGWYPIEGIHEYLDIWGSDAICMCCGAPFPSVEEIS